MPTTYQLIPSTLGLVTFAPCISSAFYSLGTESEVQRGPYAQIRGVGTRMGPKPVGLSLHLWLPSYTN